MRFLLIREKGWIRGDISHGMGIIGTYAKSIAEVKIIDNNSYHKIYSHNQLLQIISSFNPDVIGFNVHTHNILSTKELIPKITSQFPHICLIAGGFLTFSNPEDIEETGIHIVLTGEADMTILPLLKILSSRLPSKKDFFIDDKLTIELFKIPGLYFHNMEKYKLCDTGPPEYLTNIDKAPFIDHDLFNLQDYIRVPNDHQYVTNILVTQRGCPFDCPFCQGHPEGTYKKTRNNSANYKVKYIEYIINKYKHNHILFYDANFTLHRKIVMDFCQAIIDRDLHKKLTMWCETNVALPIDKEMAEIMKKAGFVEIALGVERLEEESLVKINKNKKYDVIMQNIRTLSQAGIRVTANALLGFHFDTPETIAKEEKLYTELLKEVFSVNVSAVIPMPGTEVYEFTRYKRWFLNKKMMNWQPPFYHHAYSYFDGNGWYVNFFDLSKETMKAIRGMKEKMYIMSINKLNNRFVNSLLLLLRILAKLSFWTFRGSPLVERVVFFPVKFCYFTLWRTMVVKFYIEKI